MPLMHRFMKFVARSRILPDARLLELYPPFRPMRIKVLEIANDWRTVRILLPLNALSRNPGGVMFGGYQAALADPIAALGHLDNGRTLTDVGLEEGDLVCGPHEPLSPREQEVLKLIAEAHTNKQIAEILHLAEKTVESHRANLLRKLGMRDRVELVRYAIRRGLTEA